MYFDVVLKQFRLNIQTLLKSEIFLLMGNNCCFTDNIKNIFGMCTDIYEQISSMCGNMMNITESFYDIYYSSLQFDIILGDCDSKAQECEKGETSAPVISESCKSILVEVCAIEKNWYSEPHTYFIVFFGERCHNFCLW